MLLAAACASQGDVDMVRADLEDLRLEIEGPPTSHSHDIFDLWEIDLAEWHSHNDPIGAIENLDLKDLEESLAELSQAVSDLERGSHYHDDRRIDEVVDRVDAACAELDTLGDAIGVRVRC